VYFATSDSSLVHVVDAATGKPLYRQQGKAFMFGSPAIAGDVLLVPVMNGTLEARDRTTGELLWDFQTEASRQNLGWALTSERRLNSALLYRSPWREAPLVAADRQFGVGAIFSSPVVVGKTIYFGSADGFLYALE
jgi:outer membrane protein assembly factor BamB